MANKTFSLEQEAFDLIMSYEGNKSELVNNLLLSFFNEKNSVDPEKILLRIKELDDEVKVLQLRISNEQEKYNAIKQKEFEYEEKKRIASLLDSWKKEGDLLFKQWENDEITDDEYWSRVEERKKEKEDLLKNGS